MWRRFSAQFTGKKKRNTATVRTSYTQFQLVDIDFDDDFETAIKEKQVAEQNALKAKNVTIQVVE